MKPLTPAERLRQIRMDAGLQQEEFGLRIGVSKAAISRWETGSAELTALAALGVEHVYGINSAWLLTGEGPKLVEAQVMPASQEVFLPVVLGLPWLGVEVPLRDGAERHVLPRRAAEAILRRCGAGTPADLRLVRVPDDSMRPMLGQGDLVLVNTALELRRKPSPGSVCLVRLGGRDATVAFFRRVYLHPDRNEPALELVPDAPGLRGRVQPLDGEAVEDQILGVICL